MLDLPAQHAPLQTALEAALQRVMQAADFIQGAEVQLFANELGAYLGGAHVVPCANGTDALQLALMSLGLQPGDEVIVPAFTYVASAEAVAVLGLKPVLADVLPHTFTLDPAAAAAAITPRTRAVMVVHLYGQCADLTALQRLCQQHSLALIEDNAQAIGATWQLPDGCSVAAGTVGEAGTTSFFPSKNLGAFGDGGAVLTHDAGRAAQLYQLANHGQRPGQKYVHHCVGLNSRLDTLQAALLRVKLPHLGAWTAARQQIAARYDTALGDLPRLRIPARQAGSTHVFHQYTLTLASQTERAALQQFLKQHGVPSVVYYPTPLHLQPAYQHLGYSPGAFPVADQLCRTVLSLPIHPAMPAAQVSYVAEVVQAWAQG
ncbi:DegT/DnrJ/EryC1/StrS family aminotransferase [Hymenobacter oligotrophus]|uniref:DegT/DnrJ/EryC1/StrS family aminotransferase n=1 Tax=Hymenobacter oligotrophus TaxID=2319843 RepID=A0A3B7R096_9BACT|nr:DegT/DnrJ/EryC1/StrS family aminotransferase [Hymenobacter oligotrophus]